MLSFPLSFPYKQSQSVDREVDVCNRILDFPGAMTLESRQTKLIPVHEPVFRETDDNEFRGCEREIDGFGGGTHESRFGGAS